MNWGARRAARETWSEEQFESLFRAYYDAIYRHLFRMVGSREEAEDLAQETFLRLHQQTFSADDDHNIRAWLYKVAGNLALNALRGARRREERQDRVGKAELSIGVKDPQREALRHDERALVRAVLASLSERQAEILLLRHGGLSYREVAEILGVATSSIGTMLARAERAFEAAYQRVNGEIKET